MRLFSNKKFNCLIIAVILASVFLPIFSFAQTTTTSNEKKQNQDMDFEALGWLAKWIIYPLLRFLIVIMRLFMEISGRILNWVLSPEFNRLPLTYGGIVDIGWKVLRDFANMFIVLILIVIGFATILRIETYGVKKLLPKLVLVALLINFSKVIAGAVVDASQIFMLYFLTPIHEATKDSGGAVINLFRGAQLDFLLTTLPKDISKDAHVDPGIYKTASAAFVVAFLGLAAVAFFYLAIILVARIIYIWILVIVSPLVWVAGIIPQGQKHVKNWWTRFLKECFLGVVVAFFVWMAIYLASMLSAIRQGVASNDPLSRSINSVKNESISYSGGNMMFGDMSLLLIYVVVIAFLYIAVHIARTQSNELAKFAINRTTAMGQKLMGMASGLARGGAKAGLQGLRRRMQQRIEGSEWLQKHPGWGRLLNIVPGLGLGARVKAQIEAGKETDEQKRLLVAANIPPDQLAQLAKGAAVTKEGRRRKAAAIELLAEKNLLAARGLAQTADEGRALAETLRRLGGNANAIFKSRPDWLDTAKNPNAIQENMQRRTGADRANFDVAALQNQDVLRALSSDHWDAIKIHGTDELKNTITSKLGEIKQINQNTANYIGRNILYNRGLPVDATQSIDYSAPINSNMNVMITYTDRNTGRREAKEF